MEKIPVYNDKEKSKEWALEISRLLQSKLPDELPSKEQMASAVAALYIVLDSLIETFGEYGFQFIKRETNSVHQEQ